MVPSGRNLVLGLCAAVMTFLSSASADAARCYLVAGTQDALTKERAIEKSRATLENGIAELKRQKGWKRVTVRARRAEPDPLFKAVRTKVTPDLLIKPDVKSARAYSVCWRGVGSPAVCTSGAMVCGG